MLRDTDVNLYTYERLGQQFGPFVDETDGRIPARAERDLVGEPYRRMLAEMARIVAYQWRQDVRHSALKGFLLHGGVGIGKTSMAKRLAYELCRLFGDRGKSLPREHEVVLVLVDGADIARGRYGDSEEQLKRLFDYAREGEFRGFRSEDVPERRTVLLFDDVESLFLSRSASGAKEWHFSQNSVFFHNVDELDTAHTAVVLTTNRIDLVDEAITDRFLGYEFGAPPPDVLAQVAREKAALHKLPADEIERLVQQVANSNHDLRSIREVERLVVRAYVERALSASGEW
ncbi:MAG: AAA family ATPase [Chloroflexi bacterium]|nr:AAA family ATPase [Chloroflexota bacterium]